MADAAATDESSTTPRCTHLPESHTPAAVCPLCLRDKLSKLADTPPSDPALASPPSSPPLLPCRLSPPPASSPPHWSCGYSKSRKKPTPKPQPQPLPLTPPPQPQPSQKQRWFRFLLHQRHPSIPEAPTKAMGRSKSAVCERVAVLGDRRLQRVESSTAEARAADGRERTPSCGGASGGRVAKAWSWGVSGWVLRSSRGGGGGSEAAAADTVAMVVK